MDCRESPGREKLLTRVILLLTCLSYRVNCETGDCREQEFLDHSGKCIPCKQCGPGEELSKECGFGYEEEAQCMTCRPNRFKEDWGFQKCKPCQDCALVNRFQKANCSASSNAACGDCLPGFYRKTKLGGFQDMECVPCGDPPPPYEPHCHTKVNLVKIPSTASSPRDTALAAVICSALSTVLLALLILCIIYCKRQFMEKKPTWSTRSQDLHYKGSEMSCLDRPQINPCTQRTCHQCHQDPTQACGPVHLIPSLFCDETCRMEHSRMCCSFHSERTLHERNAESLGEMAPPFLGYDPHFGSGELGPPCRHHHSGSGEAWPLMQTPSDGDAASFCQSHPDCTENRINQFSMQMEDTVIMNIDCDEGASAQLNTALSHSEKTLEPANSPDEDESPEPTLQATQAVENRSTQDCGKDDKMSELCDAKKT
ncbi:tumor necrosis factor receptor superfamily member 19 [Ambystoma mexicanum]|uniref:tumor necrosis factor receptor superfamily member 19 n=1 Tax=Ambystoma mexicanum TaxID=8296 RepID=UPI0037E709D4